MSIQYVDYEPRTEPSEELKSLVSRFRPTFGNQRDISISDSYGQLIRIYHEILLQEDRRRKPRVRNLRRLTQKEIDASKLEQLLMAEISKRISETSL